MLQSALKTPKIKLKRDYMVSSGVGSMELHTGLNRFFGFGWEQKTVNVVYWLCAAPLSYLGSWGGAPFSFTRLMCAVYFLQYLFNMLRKV